MQTLHVELGDRRYPIFIGSDLQPQELLAPYIQGSASHDCDQYHGCSFVFKSLCDGC